MFGISTHLPPHRVLTAVLVLAALVLTTVVTLALSFPWLGVLLQAQGDRVVVARLHMQTSDTALRPGDQLTGVRDASGATLDVSTLELTPEPDMAFARYSDMDAFFARQSARWDALSGDHVSLQLGDGRVVVLPIQNSRPLASLPVVFWFQLFCGIAALLAGASVWAFRWHDPAAGYYALTGVGLMLATSAAAIYSTREFVIDGELFMALSAINEFGALLFCGGLIAVLWYYPTRLSRFPAGPLIVGLYVALGLAIPLRLNDSLVVLMQLPITLGYFSTYALAAVQWRRTRGDPLQRAALRAFLLAWLFGSGAFLAVMILPAMIGIDNGAIQGYAFGFFLLIYAGIALGVLRYQLFRLDRWWFNAWRLFFGGLMVIALDLLLIYGLRIDARTSLLASLAVAGWLYFPLRQWLWMRLVPRPREDQQGLVRRVTEGLARTDRSESEAWSALLRDTYAPLNMEAQAASRDGIRHSGLVLEVAAEDGLPSLHLHYCAGGSRLFRQDDLRTLGELRRLFREILRYRNLLEDGVARERQRVARDLHDDVGARLLTLSHRLPVEQAEQVRLALSELRAVVHSMQAPPMSVRALLGQWQDEAEERCAAAGVRLGWSVEGEIADLDLAGGEALTLTRVLREALSNALRHATPERLTIHLKFESTRLAVRLEHRHDGSAPEQWTASLGLHSLRDRLAPLGGGITWTSRNGELLTEWHVDVAASSLNPA